MDCSVSLNKIGRNAGFAGREWHIAEKMFVESECPETLACWIFKWISGVLILTDYGDSMRMRKVSWWREFKSRRNPVTSRHVAFCHVTLRSSESCRQLQWINLSSTDIFSHPSVHLRIWHYILDLVEHILTFKAKRKTCSSQKVQDKKDQMVRLRAGLGTS